MALPAWIREEFDWLHREVLRLNRDIQQFSQRVGNLEKVLSAVDTQQEQIREPAQAMPPMLPADLEVDAGSPEIGVKSVASEVPIEVIGGPAAVRSTTPQAQAPPIGSFMKAAASEPGIDWEKLIGEKWMTWVGGFTLLLAIGFAVQWAWATFEVPDWIQVTGMHLLGIGLLLAGYFFHRRKLPLTGQAILGLGIFTLYAAGYAALRLYALWDEQTAFIEGAAITVLAIVVAVRANSAGVILLGALGGYLTPILTSTNSGNYVGLFTYLAFLNVALVACAVWKAWSFVKPLAIAATVAMFGLWISSSKFDAANSQMVWGTEWFAVLHSFIFLVGSTIPPVVWKQTSKPSDLLALTICSLFFVGFTWLLFHNRPEQQLALVSWGMTALHGVLFATTYARVTNADRMPRVHLALAAVFLTLAIPLQLDDAALWGMTWCLECLVFTAVGVWFRDRQMCLSALVVFTLAVGRLVCFDFFSSPRMVGDSNIDLRFLLFLISGLLGLLASGVYRLIPWILRREAEHDEWLRQIPIVLSLLGVGLLLLAPPLQMDDGIYLGPAWSIEAIAFTAVGLLVRDRLLCAAGLMTFCIAGVRLFFVDYANLTSSIRAGVSQLTSNGWNRVFLAVECSSLLGLLAGSFYWLIPKLTRNDAGLSEREREVNGSLLLGIANLAMMAGLTCQWEGRLVLVLWTLDAAIVWAAGFKLNSPAVRWYAATIGILLVGGRAIHEGSQIDGPFQLIFNSRVGSLLLVALLYFVFGGLYRWRFQGQGGVGFLESLGFRRKLLGRETLTVPREAECDPVLGILGNLTLLTAISFEIHSWFVQARALPQPPFPDMRMAEGATYSIVWAIYAALVVAAGFVLRYPLFRILGLAAFGPIVLKVFFIDLSTLRWLPRVLALAVLGLMLLGVSMLYQKFAKRLLKRGEDEDSRG